MATANLSDQMNSSVAPLLSLHPDEFRVVQDQVAELLYHLQGLKGLLNAVESHILNGAGVDDVRDCLYGLMSLADLMVTHATEIESASQRGGFRHADSVPKR